MERKYRQRGYMDDDREGKPKPARGPKGAARERPPSMLDVREVFRCAMCGHVITLHFGVSFDSQCPKCKADLHSCKNCVHFDTSSRFECTRPIAERVSPKDVRNRCQYFEIRKAVERETTTSVSKIDDPRKAFDRLFKK